MASSASTSRKILIAVSLLLAHQVLMCQGEIYR
jgi:hypothetical protein